MGSMSGKNGSPVNVELFGWRHYHVVAVHAR